MIIHVGNHGQQRNLLDTQQLFRINGRERQPSHSLKIPLGYLVVLLLIVQTLSAKESKISPHYSHQSAKHVVALRSHHLVPFEEQIALLQRNNFMTLNQNVRFMIDRGESHDESSLYDHYNPHVFLQEKSEAYKAIIPMSEFRHSHFVGPVKVGTPPQILHLIFDTGSTNVQVVGAGCTDKSCAKVRRFDPSKSATFEKTSPTIKLDITFGTGKIHSQLGSDVVSIGPYSVKDQTFGVIDHESATSGKSNIFDHIDFQGIVGFGFPSLASAGRVPFFDNIMREKDDTNDFAIYMGNPEHFGASLHNVSSAFFIGGVDPRFYEAPIKMIPVVREHYWEVGLDSFWIGDKKFCCKEGTENYVIIDSGTSFNTLPYKEMQKFHKIVPKRACGSDLEKTFKSFPTLTYKLNGGFDVVLTPEMYVIPTSEGECEPAYMQIDVSPEFGHAYILGSVPYMRHYFTVFHRGRSGSPSMIGIARSRHSKDGVSFLQSLEESNYALG